MGAFCLDRFNGKIWVTLFTGADPISPQDFSEHRTFPHDPDRPSFAGEPGYKARLRYVDDTTDLEVEMHEWDKIPRNPSDPTSELIWGWKCVKRGTYPAGTAPVQHMKIGVPW